MEKRRTASRNKNVSGAADSGESRDGGTRAVSFSDPLRKTESGLDAPRLGMAIRRGVCYAPDPDVMRYAKEMVAMCGPGRNAEFLAIGFNVAHEYFVTLQAEDEQKRESQSGTVAGEQGATSTGKELETP